MWRFCGLVAGFASLTTTGFADAQTRPAQAQTQPPAAAPQPPPVSADPQTTTATFGDWLLRCQRVGDGAQAQRACEVALTINVEGQGPIAQIALGRRVGETQMRMTVVLPSNVSFPSAVHVSADEKDDKPLELAWRRCVAGGCFADAETKDDVIKRLRAQSGQGRLKFRDAAGREVALPISYRGLNQALDALAKG